MVLRQALLAVGRRAAPPPPPPAACHPPVGAGGAWGPLLHLPGGSSRGAPGGTGPGGRGAGAHASRMAAAAPAACAPPTGAPSGRRGYWIDVRNGAVDQALRRLKRRLVDSGVLREARKRRAYVKPSAQRVVDAKASRKRLLRKELRAQMDWVLKRRERGF